MLMAANINDENQNLKYVYIFFISTVDIANAHAPCP